MPRRTDIKSVLVIGSGPIVIGQACEFDYSGTQACRALKDDGYRVVLINSNPATIMTDPQFADATYVEPITGDMIEKIIATERPDAVLATLGGQTALNAAINLHDNGTLDDYGVELIGISVDAINRGENRLAFRSIVEDLPVEMGAEVAQSRICHSMSECLDAVAVLKYPVVVRPSYTMGGAGGGIAFDDSDLHRIAGSGLALSPTTEVLLEESILGWKEFELEVVRDHADNVVIVCSIENIDPMGVHTGDSITVAPAMTLTDVEYQRLRDISIAVVRKVGVDTGGCNIQFAVNPDNGRIVVIEMNPRVSRSSALASKATGYPIAKIAAKVAIGYTLDEVKNDMTGNSAAIEPNLDYIAVKIPRFAFEKFPGADSTLTTHMKSVGEIMAIGRNFSEALGKGLRSLEDPAAGFSWPDKRPGKHELLQAVQRPHERRLQEVMWAIAAGATPAELTAATGIDPWFIDQLVLVDETAAAVRSAPELTSAVLALAKRHGLSDAQIGQLRHLDERVVRGVRHALGVRPVYKSVDTCAGEYAASTNYHYSSYDDDTEVRSRTRPAVIILGSGPNRIGQGIEFDYSCVHAAQSLSQAPGGGFETIMVNCNPETVSTDYDTSDRLYFEPLTGEDVLEIIAAESAAGPIAGVIVQLGGQTPLGLAAKLKAAGVPIVGTQPEAIELAEERSAFGQVLTAAGLPSPEHGFASTFVEARQIADEIGYPVLVRPSYVLGGSGMQIVYDEEQLAAYIIASAHISSNHPVLVDRFLDDSIEIDVDALYDGTELFMGGVMEHIEEAGVHSGDSACVIPPITLGDSQIQQIRSATEAIACQAEVRGLVNIQFALSSDKFYVLEANPRASRTVPFVAKATGYPLARAAARIMLGQTIAELRTEGMLAHQRADDACTPIAVKEAVMPFSRFRSDDGRFVDTVLGPEMRSTGEVMGIDGGFGVAFAKSQAGALNPLPTSGTIFVSVADRDKRHMIFPIKRLADLGFALVATAGTASVLARHGVHAEVLSKLADPQNIEVATDTVVDRIRSGKIALVINTPNASSHAASTRADGYEIRTAAIGEGIGCITTVPGMAAAVQGIEAQLAGSVAVRSLQTWSANRAGDNGGSL